MEIRAYDEIYLLSAQRILGDMLDCAVFSYEMDVDKFFDMFLVSGIARQFENGNPVYVAGMTGCEIAKEVMRTSGMKVLDEPDEMYQDKSPEYWSGCYEICYGDERTAETLLRRYSFKKNTEVCGIITK